jgi:exopolyphosphatase / guanosine-5'-triphosphate,3'-diphosphate pyrophosphatase
MQQAAHRRNPAAGDGSVTGQSDRQQEDDGRTRAGGEPDGQPVPLADVQPRDSAPSRGRGANGCDMRLYGALDLGTNNCRLLVARPSRRGFLVIDAFSRIIRLGEGVGRSGVLSEEAMGRTIEALKVCSNKLASRGVERTRLIATEACRIANNSAEFIERVRCETGLEIEIVSRETEARLAVSGCASLIDHSCDWALVFDIGGGSSELVWLDLTQLRRAHRQRLHDRVAIQNCIAGWTSLPVGVVTLSEIFGGRHVGPAAFEEMVAHVAGRLDEFEKAHKISWHVAKGGAHFLGTSGTVTTIAGVHLGLNSYNRNKVDGCWLTVEEVRAVSTDLLAMSFDERARQPCIGSERADLVLAGCAILEAMLRVWPCNRLRVADRGLREGILATLMAEDGANRSRRHKPQRRGKRRRGYPKLPR